MYNIFTSIKHFSNQIVYSDIYPSRRGAPAFRLICMDNTDPSFSSFQKIPYFCILENAFIYCFFFVELQNVCSHFRAGELKISYFIGQTIILIQFYLKNDRFGLKVFKMVKWYRRQLCRCACVCLVLQTVKKISKIVSSFSLGSLGFFPTVSQNFSHHQSYLPGSNVILASMR